MSNWWDTSPPAESSGSSSNWWDKIPPSSSATASPTTKQEEPSTSGDIAKSLGIGAVKGVVGLAGLPGDVESLVRRGTGWVQKKLGYEEDPDNETFLPTSSELTNGLEKNITGPLYEPKTTYGKYAQSIGEFLPGILGGPEALASRALTRVAAPALASEAAGQATEGTAVEPYARLAAAVLGHGAAQGARKSLGKGEVPHVPTEQELHDASSSLYKSAFGRGIEVYRGSTSQLADNILNTLYNQSWRRMNVPKAWDTVADLKFPYKTFIKGGIGPTVTLEDIDSVRKSLGRIRDFNNPAEMTFARRAIAAIDEYLGTLDQRPSHIANNPQFAGIAAKELREAQGNWSAHKTTENLLDKVEEANLANAATYTKSNLDNNLRRKLKQFVTNKKLSSQLSPAELEQAKAIVNGSLVGNAARSLSRPLRFLIGTIGGFHSAGIPGMIATHAAGHALSHYGAMLTRREVEKLTAMSAKDSPLYRSGTLPHENTMSTPGNYLTTGAIASEQPEENKRRLHVDLYPNSPSGFAAGGAVPRKGKKEKIKRDAFLYMDSNNTHFAECSKCSLYKKGVCTILAMRVQPEWSCGAFLKGPYGGQEVKKITTPEEVGLVKHKVRCENCVYGAGNTCKLYEMLNKDMPDKFALDTKIKPHACCNAQTPINDKNRADGGRIGFANGGDPELSPEDQQLAATMTHQTFQPNPAQTAINAISNAFQPPDFTPAHLPGTEPKDYLRELYKNPDILEKGVNQAGNFNFVGMLGGSPTYSAAGAAARAAKAQSMQPSQWFGYLKNHPGVKAQELEHVGLEPWLNSKSGQVSKQELHDFIQSKQPQITEVRKGQPDWEAIEKLDKEHSSLIRERSPNNNRIRELEDQINKLTNDAPMYNRDDLKLPGGENYEETLLTVPNKPKVPPISQDENNFLAYARDTRGRGRELTHNEMSQEEDILQRSRSYQKALNASDQNSYKSTHWSEPNVLLHVRHNDRNIPGGGKSLHLEEVQSDWHQAGRQTGYSGDEKGWTAQKAEFSPNGYIVKDKNGNVLSELLADSPQDAIKQVSSFGGRVPDAPFKTTWPDLALKRMLHRAATEKNPDGSYKYDSLSWTPGQAQADRYDLSKQVKRVYYIPETQTLRAKGHNGETVIDETVPKDKLGDFIGKDAAQKLLNQPLKEVWRDSNGSINGHDLTGLDLKLGGEGMKAFYDKMLVDKANALTKKYGTRVQPKQISTGYRTIQAGPGDWRVVDPNNKGIGSFKTKEEAQRAALSNEPKVWHLPITPELRKAAEGGLPTFAHGGGVLGYEDGGDVEPLSDSDMAQSAAEAAAARVRAPYVRSTDQPHSIYNKLTGSHGEERYQLWPEKLVRGAGSALNAGIDYIENLDPTEIAKEMYHSAISGATAPRDAFTGKLQVTDPETGMPSKEAIERARDITQLAMTGGMPASEAGALGMAGGKLGKQTTTRTEEAGLLGRRELPGGEGQLEAPRVADKEISPVNTETPLEGLPRRVKIPGHEDIEAGPHPIARQAARDYMEEAGLPYNPPSKYVKVDPENGKRIAQAFEEMKHDPDNPEVIGAYQAMADETMAQWKAIKKTGLKVDFIEGADPYHASPRLAIEDIKNNNHMWVYPTDTGFGEVGKGISKEAEAINPLLKQSGENFGGVPARINDIFRVVHDYFGHVKEGVGFRADGEENAWRSHAAMYSPEARRAMTSETRGQNSWVNWGPHGETNRTSDTPNTVFAEQKIGLMPDWAVNEGRADITPTPPGVNKLTVNDILHPDYPTLPARSRNVTDIAEELQNRGRVALKEMGLPEKIEKPNPKSDEVLSHAMASEIEAAMSRSGKNASEWYTAKIQRAMELASQLHPEIATDPNMAMAYRAALAITSQGEKVTFNVRLANMAYETYKKTGQFPTNVAAKKGKSINNNLRILNSLINNMGPEGARNFLSQEFTVRELNDMGYNIKEGLNQKVNGSAIFGPKIGQGFYQNLSGNYDPVTMDLWFMRSWGRLTGTLKGKNPKVSAKQRERFVNELNEEGIPVPNSDEALLQKADDLVAKHEKHFFANREKYDSEEFTKSDLTKAAERYAFGFRGLNEAPSSGGQRAWMRSVVNRARELLAERGLNVTNADLQAIWWYPEKELYGKLGGRDAEAINVDYADALTDLLEKGKTNEEGGIHALENGPGRGSTVNEPGGGRGSSKKGKRTNEEEGTSLPKVRAYGGAVNEGMYRNYADGGDPNYDPTLDDAYQAQQAREVAAGRLRQQVQPEEGRENSGQLGEAMLDALAPGYSAQKAFRQGNYGEALSDIAPYAVPGAGSVIKALAPAARPLIRGAGAFLAGTGVGAGGAFLNGESEAGEELTPLQKTLIAKTPRDKRPELLKQFAAESAQRQAEQERVGREKEARAQADAEARKKLQSEIESLPEEERAMYAGFNPEQRATYWAHKAEEKRRADEQALEDARAKEHESLPFLQRFPTIAKYLPAVASSAAAAIPYSIRLRQAAVANKYLREWENTASSAEHALRTGNMDEAAIHVNKLKQYNTEHEAALNNINKGVHPAALASSASIPFDLEFLTPNSIDALTLPPGNPAHDKAIEELTTPSEYASRAGSALVQGAVPALTSTKIPIPGRITPPTAASMGHVATFDQRAAERAAEVAEQARLAANAAKNETRRQNMIAKAKAEALRSQAANPGWNTPAPKRTRKTKGTEEPGRAYGGRIMSHYIDHNPSEAQKEAGNYRKYHVNFHGLEIALENAKGSTRSGVDKNGKAWKSTLPAHYGYVKGSTGRDGDHIDAYLGPHHASKKIFVINQKDADTRRFDEHKAFIGFGSEPQVKSTFMKAFSDGKGKERLGHITEMTIPEFKTFLEAESSENASS